MSTKRTIGEMFWIAEIFSIVLTEHGLGKNKAKLRVDDTLISEEKPKRLYVPNLEKLGENSSFLFLDRFYNFIDQTIEKI